MMSEKPQTRKQRGLIAWYSKLPITIKAAVVAGIFSLIAAFLTLLFERISPQTTVIVLVPTLEQPTKTAISIATPPRAATGLNSSPTDEPPPARTSNPTITPHNTPIPSPTITPGSGLPLSPTPSPVIYLVTMQSGSEVQLTSLKIGVEAYMEYAPGVNITGYRSELYGSAGIPLDNGIVVALDYVNRVDFVAQDGGLGPVTITFVDGMVQEHRIGSMGSPMVLQGETGYGAFERPLKDIRAIELRRGSARSSMPQGLAKGPTASVATTDGETTQISNPKLDVFYYHNVIRECTLKTYQYLPTIEGLQIHFAKIARIEVLHDDVEYNPIPMRITTREGERLEYQIAQTSPIGSGETPARTCMLGWYLSGDSLLGKFVIPLISVREILFE